MGASALSACSHAKLEEDFTDGWPERIAYDDVPPPDAGGLLEDLLDLREAFPDDPVVPMLVIGHHTSIVCKRIDHGSTLDVALKKGNEFLVGGFVKRVTEGWDYYSADDVAFAQSGQRFDATLLQSSNAIRLSQPPTSNALRDVLPWNDTEDQVLCWKIDWTKTEQSESQNLLHRALGLVLFNATTKFAQLQASFEVAQQQLEDKFSELSVSSLLQEMTKDSNATEGDVMSQGTWLQRSETSLIQEERDSMPIHEMNFKKFLEDPTVSSEVGFRMRLVIVGHPSVPVFEVMQLLTNMEESDLAIPCKALRIKHRTVLSDIDDTVHPAHDAQTIAIAGQDVTPITKGDIYPTIEKVHRRLVACPEDNRVCFPVFLSARPPTLAQKRKVELQRLAKKITADHQCEKDKFLFILPGADDVGGMLESFLSILKQTLPGTQKGAITTLGKKKVERFFQYVRLFPEPSYVFIGDDGQGDFEAALSLLSLARDQISPQTLSKAKEASTEKVRHSTVQEVATTHLGNLMGYVRSLADEDWYVTLLQQELKSRQKALTFSEDNPPVFDFVAIKAVRTNSGFLFSKSIRKKREDLMKQVYGTNRFFYFENYNELMRKLQAAHLVET